MPNEDELTPSQAAKILGVSAATVRRWGKDGILPPSRRFPSGHRRYSRTAVEALKLRLDQPDTTKEEGHDRPTTSQE